MAKHAYKFAVVGQLTPRQKLMTVKLMRESGCLVVAMDEVNAEDKKIAELAECLVVFKRSHSECGFDEQLGIAEKLGFSIGHVVFEGEDFGDGSLPKEKTDVQSG
jgi:hypothetical protein